MIRTIFAITALLVSAEGAMAQEPDPAAGAIVFKKCIACHAAGEGAKNRVGPVLNNVYGRTAGTGEGFNYSRAMIDAGKDGLVWTHDTLKEYISAPKVKVPGNRMSFAGIPDPTDLANLLAYLQTFSPDYVPPPAADAAAPATPDGAAPVPTDPAKPTQ